LNLDNLYFNNGLLYWSKDFWSDNGETADTAIYLIWYDYSLKNNVGYGAQMPRPIARSIDLSFNFID
jgi:hypothetical protein